MVSIHVFADPLEIDLKAETDCIDRMKLLENVESLSLIGWGQQVAR